MGKNPQNLVIEVFILKKSMQTPSYRALVMGDMQGARHSPNILPTMPQYQAFRIIRWKKYVKEAIP
jgi:hypothetical protein